MNDDLQQDLTLAIQSRNFAALRESLENLSPTDIASLIVGLAVDEQVIVFRILPRKKFGR